MNFVLPSHKKRSKSNTVVSVVKNVIVKAIK